ncbi:hypothetical protein WMF37_05050 [Sorangium sp. So ce291]|uniref:hypothetical protein n=1 Tax=Sorangium sp. So ce291 TaxID=3133294 RepID=UPI003F640AA2
MTAEDSAAYATEIRSFLLGRLSSRRASHPIERQRSAQLPRSPIVDWWVFEGRSYDGLNASLAGAWTVVHRQSRQLLATSNPTWLQVRAPEGEIDWVGTALLQASTSSTEFQARASKVGLGLEERAALLGWLEWIGIQWQDYVRSLGAPPGCDPTLPWAMPPIASDVGIARLRRWAHTARRSRWPLLRNVVAETLRCHLEPQQIDRVPLPTEHARLFELLCLVRVLAAIEGLPPQLRWLDVRLAQNTLRSPTLSCHYQYAVQADAMLKTEAFGGGLREAVLRHGVRVPRYIDLLFLFDRPRSGFKGILLEAKSGKQEYYSSVHQLSTYRAALRSIVAEPLLIWGVIEQAQPRQEVERQLDELRHELADGAQRDMWVFSSARDIDVVLETLRLACTDADGARSRIGLT